MANLKLVFIKNKNSQLNSFLLICNFYWFLIVWLIKIRVIKNTIETTQKSHVAMRKIDFYKHSECLDFKNFSLSIWILYRKNIVPHLILC